MPTDQQDAAEDDAPTATRLWVGPARTTWWRYQLAQAFLTLRFRVPAIRHVPGLDAHVTDRAFDVVLGSRDIVATDDDTDAGGGA